MKNLLTIFVVLLTTLNLFGEYVSIALPKTSETGDTKKFYDASIAVDNSDAKIVSDAVAKILSADGEQLKKLITNPALAPKSVKYLKLARLNKDVKILSVNFGKYKVALFEIPQNSRMRKGMNFFAFEQTGERLLWNVNVNDMYLSLMAQCNIANPKKIDIKKIPTTSASDKSKLNDIVKNKLPVLVFANSALLSVDPVASVSKEPAAKFYKKIQDIFFSWQIDEYANYMSPKSREKFNSQYAGMNATEKKQVLSDYFSWKKKYLKVCKLSDNEFIVIFKRKKNGNPDQIDLAYITLTSKDGSSGFLEKFGEKTPLDLMLSRYVFKNILY